MTAGPHEPDPGTGKPGPLERAPRAPVRQDTDAGWVTDPDRPYIQRHPTTGRVRTNGYTPDRPLKE